MKKIDVIIPMYNRAHCIDHLLDTLQSQTMQDFRVIFVDDGSVDETQKILPEAMKRVAFPYLLIAQENKGAGAARNTGLKVSDAEWIVFVDSDDTLVPEYLEYLYNAVTRCNADFGYCDFVMIPDAPDIQVPEAGALKMQAITAAECMKLHYTKWLSNATLMIRGSFQRENKIFYDEDCTYTEDNTLVTDLIAAANTVAKVNNVLYLYHIYSGSRSRSPDITKYISGIESFKRTEAKLKDADTEAAKAFRAMAPGRYYLATYRKAAVQTSYKDFCKLADLVPMKPYREQFATFPLKHRIAGYVLLMSKTLFYWMMRLMFRD